MGSNDGTIENFYSEKVYGLTIIVALRFPHFSLNVSVNIFVNANAQKKKKSIVPQTSTVFRAQTNDVSVNKNARGDPNILESSYDLQRVMNKVSARSKVKPLKN